MDLVKLTSRLIELPSVSPPSNSLRETAEFISDWLHENGANAEILELDRGYPIVVSKSMKTYRKSVMLNGHFDVVPPGDLNAWKYPPFSPTLIDGKLFGRGSSDMKSGLAVFMQLYVDLIDRVDYNLIFTAVPDEETGGEHGSKKLADIYKPDLVLISEPTGKDRIVLGEKGMITFRLKAKGRSSHGSIPSQGENAIMKITRDITNLSRLNMEETSSPMGTDQEFEMDMKKVTINVGFIRGGIKSNVVPDFCEAEVDVRVPLSFSIEEVMEGVKSVAKESEIELINSSPPNFTHPSTPYVTFLEKAMAEVTGLSPKKVAVPYSTDGKHFRKNGTSVIVYGPGSIKQAHSVDEFVEVEEINSVYNVYSSFLKSLRL
ncbi:M20 family metallopeptidase [Sulfuracidifex metallicus]|uniref:M20 family metallopeptidase n=1 Tax=Sulfuracidifex metallicus TaxID=47303 RepID=UPI002275784E|nr:M20 family metallopeptidase [Sulfuracidifex metallicus]MCY0850973.1 M20 family metallopeptidase [Sulfuracidifex metallicus]